MVTDGRRRPFREYQDRQTDRQDRQTGTAHRQIDETALQSNPVYAVGQIDERALQTKHGKTGMETDVNTSDGQAGKWEG